MAIDRKRIIDSLSRIKVAGNAEGLIPAFGVFVDDPGSFLEFIRRAAGLAGGRRTARCGRGFAGECGPRMRLPHRVRNHHQR